jgi:hypothetical protein
VVVEAPLEELPLPVVDLGVELSELLPEAPGVVDEPDEPDVPTEDPPDDFEDGLVVVEEVPEPPAGGVAVELRGVVPELPDEPLEPLLSPQPTSASVPSTTPARSVRLSIETLLPQYSKTDGYRCRTDAVIRIRERQPALGIPWQCSDKRDGFLTSM